MPYIGVSPSNGVRKVFDYTATAGQTSFSGSDNNSQTLAYTDSAYIDVFQNGVLLIPSDYTATTGTSVVLDTGATVSDSVQIVVFDVFSVADTVSAANGGTFESNISIGGTLGITGDVTIGDASAADKKILFDGNAQDFHIGLDDSEDSLTIGLGSTLGTTSHMIFDANGIITKPLQPAFHATVTSNQNDIAVNSDVVPTYATETYDVNGDYNNSNYTFTAPVTGKYLICFTIYLENIDTAANYYEAYINTSNRDYYAATIDPDLADADFTYFSFTGSSIVDMDASDTAKIIIRQAGGTAQSDIKTPSFFSGALIC